jgi:fusion protein PurCD
MREISLRLFESGSRLLAERGILLADTKYEFGMVEGALTLIDEIHTPDSSRFWSVGDHAADPANVKSLDKEYARSWLRANRTPQGLPDALPDEVVAGTAQRYQEIFSRITGAAIETGGQDIHERIRDNLIREGLIKDAFVAVVMGSIDDLEHANRIVEALRPYGVMTELRVVSAHKNGEDLVALAEDYNHTVEPCAVVAVAGLSNGLGGALAANLTVPVISCPPFADRTDLMLNLASSLMLPSKVPAATVIRPQNAAQFALRALNLPRLRRRLSYEIQDTKVALRAADRRVRGR